MRRLLSRLEILETRVARGHARPGISPAATLAMAILAHRRGQWAPAEAVADGYARALGYDRPGDLRAALGASPGDVRQRHATALRELIAGEGIDLDAPMISEDDWQRTAGLLDRWRGELPPELRARLSIGEEAA